MKSTTSPIPSCTKLEFDLAVTKQLTPSQRLTENNPGNKAVSKDWGDHDYWEGQGPEHVHVPPGAMISIIKTWATKTRKSTTPTDKAMWTKRCDKLGWKCHTRYLSNNWWVGTDIIGGDRHNRWGQTKKVGTDIRGGDRHNRWGQI